MRHNAFSLSTLRFGARTSLFTENPLSTAAWPWDKVRRSCIIHQRPSCLLLICASKKNVSKWSSPNRTQQICPYETGSPLHSFLYCIHILSAFWCVLHFLSTSFVSTSLNIATTLSGSAAISLGSKHISFLAKLYFRGLLSCILLKIAANIAQHFFLNSKTCYWLSFSLCRLWSV